MRTSGGFVMLATGFVLSVLPVHGAIYRSNSIGQPLEAIDDSQYDCYPYVLEVTEMEPTGERRVLHGNGGMLSLTVETTDAQNPRRKTVVETRYDPQGNEIDRIRTTYDRDLPVSVSRTDGSTSVLILYNYDSGRLIESKELENGIMVKLTTYYRGVDGMLSGMRVVELAETPVLSYFSNEEGVPVYGEGDDEVFSKFSFHPGSSTLREVWVDGEQSMRADATYDEAGRLVVSETVNGESVKKTYGPDGMLVREVYGDDAGQRRTIDYQYDANGAPDHSVEIVGGEHVRRIERWYREGAVQSQTEWVDDVPVKSTRYLLDGTSVVTLFDNGRPYADVTYASDGKQVLSLEYRKER